MPGGPPVPLCARCCEALERGDPVPLRMVPAEGRPVPFTETAGLLRRGEAGRAAHPEAVVVDDAGGRQAALAVEALLEVVADARVHGADVAPGLAVVEGLRLAVDPELDEADRVRPGPLHVQPDVLPLAAPQRALPRGHDVDRVAGRGVPVELEHEVVVDGEEPDRRGAVRVRVPLGDDLPGRVAREVGRDHGEPGVPALLALGLAGVHLDLGAVAEAAPPAAQRGSSPLRTSKRAA